MTDEEKKAIERIDYIQDFIIENGQYNADVNDMEYFLRILNLIEKQSKEIEELQKTLKCTQNSWYEDTQKIEELKEVDKSNSQIIANMSERHFHDREKITKYEKLVDKIKAKIEEYQYLEEKNIEDKDNMKPEEAFNKAYLYTRSIWVLQSLLEKENI